MSQMFFKMPLVGSHFNPPSKQLLTALPSGLPLVLVPDPDNPYDAKAIKVMFEAALLRTVNDTNSDGVDDALQGTGFDIDRLEIEAMDNRGLVMLGHLPDADGRVAKKLQCQGNRHVAEALAGLGLGWNDLTTTLGFDANGAAEVRIELLKGEK